MKKILFINASSRISGSEMSLIDLLYFLKNDFHLSIVLPEKTGLYFRLEKEYNPMILNLIRLKKSFQFQLLLKYFYNLLQNSFKIIRIIRQKEIAIIYSNGTNALIYSIIPKIISGRKLIWHIRDKLPNKFFTIFLGFFCDKIICTSSFIADQVPGYKEKKVIIYNGIDTDFWAISQPSPNILREEYNIPAEKVIIAHIGQLIPWKNHHHFIELANEILKYETNVHFVIIGSDIFNEFSSYTKSLNSKAEQLVLTDNINFIDFKNNIKELLGSIDILVHLATDEPFGRVVIEGMAMNKPVLAMNHGGPSEIIENNRSGFLFDNLDITLIAESINRLIKSPVLRKSFGIAGRLIIEKNFSLENYTAVNKILHEL